MATPNKPRLDERFVIQIEGKEFVKYPGLLDLAHQKGIAQIEVEPLQLPTKDNDNMAICKALVVSKEGDSFSDIGDANPKNVNTRIAKHLLRMASTRAIARALRSYTNIGMTCLEELADISDAMETKPKRQSAKKKAAAPKKAAPAKPVPVTQPRPKPVEVPAPVSGDRPKMSEAQRKAIYNLAHRRGITPEELEQMALEAYGTNLQHLSTGDASSFIRSLQQAA